jgi:hypothetical protein
MEGLGLQQERRGDNISLWIGIGLIVFLAIIMFMPNQSICPALALKYQNENLSEIPRQVDCFDGNSCTCNFTFKNGSNLYEELKKPSFDTEQAGLITFIRYIKEIAKMKLLKKEDGSFVMITTNLK